MDFEMYRKPVSKDIQAAGITVHVKYSPARALSQFKRFAEEACWDEPVLFSEIEKIGLGWFGCLAFDGNERVCVSPDVPWAPKKEAANAFFDFMKVMALFTDDGALTRLIEDAPKDRDGHLPANTTIFECHMDAVFSSADFYILAAKTVEVDQIEIKLLLCNLEDFDSFDMGISAGELLSGERYADIAQRMGLQAGNIDGVVSEGDQHAVCAKDECSQTKPGNYDGNGEQWWQDMARRTNRFVERHSRKKSTTVQAAGIVARVGNVSTWLFEDVACHVSSALRVYTPASVKEVGFFQFLSGASLHSTSAYDSIMSALMSPEYLSDDEAYETVFDFLKVMALLNDDEAKIRLVEDAPKKKDGHLKANCLVLDCSMPSAFDGGSYYAITARTQSGDEIGFVLEHRHLMESPSCGKPISPKQLLTCERFGDIAQRMGLQSSSKNGSDSIAAILSELEADRGFSQSFETLLDTMACYPLTISVVQGEEGLGKKAERRRAALCSGDLVSVEGQWNSAGVRLGVSAKGLKMGEGIVADDSHSAAAKRCPSTAAVAFLLSHTKATVLSTHEQAGACDGFSVRLELEPFSLDGLCEEYEAYLDAPLGRRERRSIRRREVR